MTRFFVKFSYIGTRYRGLQRDNSLRFVNDADTVQGAIECALSTVKPSLRSKPYFVLSSRTDVGVHALENTGHVDLDSAYKLKATDVLIQTNHFFSYCRHDIRIQDVIPVSDAFHCRGDARARTYVYRFMKSNNPTATFVPYLDSLYHFKLRSVEFDLEKAKKAASLFRGVNDFRTFCAEELPPYKKSVRELEVSDITQSQSLTPYDPLSQDYEYYTIRFKSSGFLYNQIRRMTGAIMACGAGKITEKDIKVMLQVPGRHNWHTAVHPLPAHGLQLVNVEYDPDVIDAHRLKNE